MPDAIFISGGSRGIGRALGLRAAQAGWDVAFTFNSAADAAEETQAAMQTANPGGTFKAYELNVRDPDAVDGVAGDVLDTFENLAAVVPNAGVSINGLAYAMPSEDWATVIDTNLTGAFYVARAFLPDLVAQRGGSIVLISSVSAGGASGQAAYAASKAGLIGLGQALAKEYGPKGVRTNTVIPGYFDTDMTRDTMSDELSEFAISYCPLRRLGGLEELADTVLFLAGAGGGFINGETVRVTGGLDWAP